MSAGKVIDVNFDNIEATFDEMVHAQAEQLKKEQDSTDEATKKTTIGILTKLRDYISSAKFNLKCRWDAKKRGVNYNIVKLKYVGNLLGKIADVLGLTIDITGEVIMYAVKFLSTLINSVVNLVVIVCKKIISLFTLNCGETCHA